jgi:hypothetical protein
MLYFSDKKRELALAESTAYIREVHNMEVRTHLQMLDLLCSTTDQAYREVQKRCISKVRQLHKDHKPINKHHKQLEWIVVYGLYPLYKQAFRLKYCR